VEAAWEGARVRGCEGGRGGREGGRERAGGRAHVLEQTPLRKSCEWLVMSRIELHVER
jgi:hypothetical protein